MKTNVINWKRKKLIKIKYRDKSKTKAVMVFRRCWNCKIELNVVLGCILQGIAANANSSESETIEEIVKKKKMRMKNCNWRCWICKKRRSCIGLWFVFNRMNSVSYVSSCLIRWNVQSNCFKVLLASIDWLWLSSVYWCVSWNGGGDQDAWTTLLKENFPKAWFLTNWRFHYISLF